MLSSVCISVRLFKVVAAYVFYIYIYIYIFYFDCFKSYFYETFALLELIVTLFCQICIT